MSNEMISLNNLPSKHKYDDDVFQEMQSGDFLPRIQLMTSNSTKCKAGEFPINHYALIRDQQYEDIGPSIDFLICDWRPLAMEIGDNVISTCDYKGELYKDIQERSSISDSGCMWGPQFLVWFPAAKCFATFFCGSKTARRAGPKLKARMNQPATMDSVKIEKGKHTWFGPTVSDCSTEFELPLQEDYDKFKEKFENPPKQTTELAPEDGRAQ